MKRILESSSRLRRLKVMNFFNSGRAAYAKFDDGSWRYKRAAFYSNGKIKPNVVID